MTSSADASSSAAESRRRKFRVSFGDEGDARLERQSPCGEDTGKRQRIIGPSLLPSGIQETKSEKDNDSDNDSSGDDDIGPSLPPSDNVGTGDEDSSTGNGKVIKGRTGDQQTPLSETPVRGSEGQRDEWMLVPPEHMDWSSRVDPTKLRNRKFNTGRSARDPYVPGNRTAASWTETPQQKRRRLENEVMGIESSAPAGLKQPTTETSRSDDAICERIQSFNDKTRKRTLYEEHQRVSSGSEKQDDPSLRPFDREKDIAGPATISSAQRREMVNRSADFSTRFTKGKFL